MTVGTDSVGYKRATVRLTSVVTNQSYTGAYSTTLATR